MRRVSELTGVVDLSEIRKFGEVKKGYTPFQNGDIIFAKITPCMENGKVAILTGLSNKIGFGSTEFHVLRLPNYIPRKYLFYYLIQESFRRDAERNMTGSVGQKRVPADYLKHTSVPIPPLPEQHRIVAKIEELFSRLDAGVEALKQVQSQLKRYRLSVLKATVEGRLTAEWREQHKNELEPADKLLERILKERREKWEAEQLAKYKAQGKIPPKNWRDKYKEPTPPDITGLPELPEGWVWLAMQMISEWSNGKGLTKKQIMPGEYPVFGGNGINSYHNSYLSETECIVVGRVGAHCGNIHIAQAKSWITDNAIYTKWISKLLDIKFAGFALSNKNLNKISGGSGQPYVSQLLLNLLPFALPLLDEQKQIVANIMREYSIIDELEKTIKIELKRTQSLRQSILKLTFEGKLVPQDPDDEPASVLLERIKAEKAKSKKSKQLEMF